MPCPPQSVELFYCQESRKVNIFNRMCLVISFLIKFLSAQRRGYILLYSLLKVHSNLLENIHHSFFLHWSDISQNTLLSGTIVGRLVNTAVSETKAVETGFVFLGQSGLYCVVACFWPFWLNSSHFFICLFFLFILSDSLLCILHACQFLNCCTTVRFLFCSFFVHPLPFLI